MRIKSSVVALLILSLNLSLFPHSAQAVQTYTTLSIDQITENHTYQTVTISWITNRPATAIIQYGLNSNSYIWSQRTNVSTTNQGMTLSGLVPETKYYFRITAITDNAEVTSVEQSFVTTKITDDKAPIITEVSVPGLTGRTATIQWRTDEPATTEVQYGFTTAYGKSASSGGLQVTHDLTITGLEPGTLYHFLIKGKDKDNNVTRWEDMTFRTLYTDQSDKNTLSIYGVNPSAANESTVTRTTAVISWQTNRLTQGWVSFGTTTNYGATITTSAPRKFIHSVTITGLTPGVSYYFSIKARDIYGKEITSNGFSFTTKGDVLDNPNIPQPQVLGAATCDVDLTTDHGFAGLYYNLSKDHPDVEGNIRDNDWQKIGRENTWYDGNNLVFERVDANLNFGSNFFPVNQGLPRDPHYFAVNWRSIINVPKTGKYNFSMTADDDAWLFIDDNITSNLGGVHAAKTDKQTIQLTAGWHKLEIFYADRKGDGATFSFTLDSKIKTYPLPSNCEMEDVVHIPKTVKPASGGDEGQVLGASTADYTPIIAFYRTSGNRDIYAILATGQKHYITPAAYDNYGYNQASVKVVSTKTLARYPDAQLVRTPENSTVYFLYKRPDQWLKLELPTPTVFVSYPNNAWSNVARIDQADLDVYPEVHLVKVAGDSTVYVIGDGYKHKILSEGIFNREGYDRSQVVEISQTHLDYFPVGKDIN